MSNWFDPFNSSSGGGGGGPVKLSTKEGNTLVNESDGLYGTPEQISAKPGNALVREDDGLYAKQRINSKSNFNLNPNQWTEDKTITILGENIKSNSIISLGVQNNITEDQYNKLAAAKIIVKEQNEGAVVLKAFGDIPDESIPMEIIIADSETSIDGTNIALKDRTTSLFYTLFINNGKLNFEEVSSTEKSIIYTEIILKDRTTGRNVSVFMDNGSLYMEQPGNYITLDNGSYITLTNGDRLTYEVN